MANETQIQPQKGNIMLKRIIKILFILLLSVVFIGSLAIAQGKGKNQNNDRPAGWDKGKKEGWKSDVPPGQEENEERKKQKKSLSSKEEDLEDNEKEKKEKKEKKQKREKQKNKEKKSKETTE